MLESEIQKHVAGAGTLGPADKEAIQEWVVWVFGWPPAPAPPPTEPMDARVEGVQPEGPGAAHRMRPVDLDVGEAEAEARGREMNRTAGTRRVTATPVLRK